MQEASQSVPSLLRPLAETAAKIWLAKSGYDSVEYLDKSEFEVWFLKGYLALSVDGSIPAGFANFIWDRDSSISHFTADELKQLAEWAQLERTTHWYTGLGWIPWKGGENDDAVQMLKEAIELVRMFPPAPLHVHKLP